MAILAFASVIFICILGILIVIPSVRNGLHAYIYGRWTRQYVALIRNIWSPQTNGLGGRWLAERYHGKVITPEQAAAIVTLDHNIMEQEIEQVIPYKMARSIVLDGPPDITVYECACRASKKQSCEPTQVCMVVGQPYADFILRHHPGKSRRLGRDEALMLLREEHARGHLHSAWFKDVLDGRFYVICNCCKCCCGGIEAMMRYDAPAMISSGYVAAIDPNLCISCGKCAKVCPFEAIKKTAAKNDLIDIAADGGKIKEIGSGEAPRQKGDEKYIVDSRICMGCAVCVTTCSKNAVSFSRDTTKPEPLDVRLLS